MDSCTCKKIHLLDEAFFAEAEALYDNGLYEKHICDYFNISGATWLSWKKKGEEISNLIEEEKLDSAVLSNEQKNLLRVYITFKKGRVKVLSRNLEVVRRAAEQGNVWQAAAWILERLDFEHFGRKEKMEHSGDIHYSVVPAPKNPETEDFE